MGRLHVSIRPSLQIFISNDFEDEARVQALHLHFFSARPRERSRERLRELGPFRCAGDGMTVAVWIGRCRLTTVNGEEYALVAAAQVDGLSGWQREIRSALEAQGWQWLGAVETLPEPAWAEAYPDDAEAAALVRAVAQGQRLAFGKIRQGEIRPVRNARKMDEGRIKVHLHEAVQPLDAQLGQWPKRCVPAGLRDLLFGALPAGKAGPGAARPPKCYAILDATRIPLLPELLAAARLRHTSLFKGDAASDLRSVAPYLVELDESNDLTRRLFTRSPAPQDLWDAAPGIFLRSSAGIEVLQRHFRRFTRIADPAGNWLYFRFWEAGAMASLFALAGKDLAFSAEPVTITTPLARLLGGQEEAITCLILPQPETGRMMIAELDGAAIPGPLVADQAFLDGMGEAQFARFIAELAHHCARVFPDSFAHLSPEEAQAAVRGFVEQGQALGLTQRGPLFVWAELCVLWGAGALHDPLLGPRLRPAFEAGGSQMQIGERLHAQMAEYAETVLGRGAAHLRAALLRVEALSARPEGESLLRLLKELWPEKARFVGEAALSAFLSKVVEDAGQLPQADLLAQRTYVGTCFFLGTFCAHDPLHSWLHPALSAPANRGEDSRLLRTTRRWRQGVIAQLEAGA